ncbi:Bcr/CflA family multidrug efflux MFS transporter [Pseudoalteromonas piscicida]|uniref:Bcr/CflA family efflux transporter n=1 Tax=Pseudoalteromonas piscicida TaxID=43662 RepID=A0AAD0RQ95_PSEO7|nr:Bcr/CflA family multidrug efflux MFS transporter [Pseudoalteromonas piscicida]ASD66623.1 Bcr/CflA family drug resistance efflux transporter [Pseudoalteromonas piscicida]AXQ97547.1 Bcr/CflA family drug resistance efflux transporter [Pseudoalteromonas piscicida]AXR02663.1 Bcr/CflA family drug resistance efflux transporter [Pseudoalteromonas piscicida]
MKSSTLPAILLPLLASIVAITPLAIDLYLPAMLAIADSLNSPLEQVQVSLSSYLAGYAVGMMVFGPLADRFSRQTLAIWGLVGFTASSIGLALTNDIDMFCFLRVVQAFCGAAATVVVPGVIRYHYKEHTAKGMSYVSMIMMIAPLIAPSLGALILLYFDWHAIFWFLAVYAVLVIIALQFFCIAIPTKADVPLSLSFFLKNYRIVLTQKKARYDILSSMLASFAFFCFLTSVSFIYLEYYAVSEQLFGVLFAMNVIALMLGNFANTRLVPRLGSRKMLNIGLTIGVVCSTLLVILSSQSVSVWILASAIAPLMMSLGIIASNADALILLSFEHQTGTATAVIGTLRFGSGALVGPLLALAVPESPMPFSSFMFAAIVLTIVCQLLNRRFEKSLITTEIKE